jgi:hypothetical protein
MGKKVKLRWPKRRWNELFLMRELVSECRRMDTANGVIGRLKRVVRLAEKLDGGAVDKDFFRWLQEQAVEEVED